MLAATKALGLAPPLISVGVLYRHFFKDGRGRDPAAGAADAAISAEPGATDGVSAGRLFPVRFGGRTEEEEEEDDDDDDEEEEADDVAGTVALFWALSAAAF